MARLKEKRDFGAHLFIYLVVNGFLIGIWAFTGAGFFWPVFPLFLWGIGLVLTAWDVYWRKPVSEGRIRREIERMREFGLGRYVLGSPWSDLLASYNLSDGRIWALVPVWMGFGPAALQRLRTIRSKGHGRACDCRRPSGPDKALEPRAQGRAARALTLAIPLVVPAGMRVLFPVLARRLGGRRGHLAGFAVYWAGCCLIPLTLLGRRHTWALLREPPGPRPRPRWLSALALWIPPLGAVGTELLPALRGADPAVVATAGAMAAVNATGEELLWRGLFVAAFPDDAVRGWLWPAIGFTAWHLAPTSVRPARQGRMFLAGAALIGAGFGWVAFRTRSLRLTLPAHLLTDASGLPAARFLLGRGSTSS